MCWIQKSWSLGFEQVSVGVVWWQERTLKRRTFGVDDSHDERDYGKDNHTDASYDWQD
jgi:hypothetical protein